jgi:hypothetical protein
VSGIIGAITLIGLTEGLRWINEKEKQPQSEIVLVVTTPIAKPEVKAAEQSSEERIFVGKNVTPRYLMNFFEEHTGIQANKLAQAYIGKWIVVEGTLAEVLSTDLTRAQVTFQTDPALDQLETVLHF